MGQIICIDFDGVLCDPNNVAEGFKMGAPIPEALDAMQDLYDAYHVIIHTTRANTPSGRKAVADWLEYFDVDYHEIVGKPKADWYVDDRALRFTTWDKARKELLDE